MIVMICVVTVPGNVYQVVEEYFEVSFQMRKLYYIVLTSMISFWMCIVSWVEEFIGM